MPEALDPLPLLAALHDRRIEYIVVGGFAVNTHGYIRVTKDLDIVPSPAQENLQKLAEMLGELNATVLDSGDFRPEELPAHQTRAADLAIGGNFCVLTDLGRLDVTQWLSGVDVDDLYVELDPDAIESTVEGVPVRVCGLEHLRAMKRAAGRPEDLRDLERLGEAPEQIAQDTPTGVSCVRRRRGQRRLRGTRAQLGVANDWLYPTRK